MNGLDLFSGIGGLSIALAPWVRPIAYCEVERYAQALLLSRMADGTLHRAAIWDDVRTLRGDLLPRVDIIYGGFPCQDISVAGRGAGLAGERSGLVSEIFRLIDEVRPTFVFLENVPAIRTRGGERVVKELAARGYDCRWDCLSAYDVGAPHKRERWFLLAYSKGGGCGEEPEVDVGHPERSGEEGCSTGLDIRSAAQGSNWWSVEPDVGRVADGVPNRAHRLRALGNAVVPAQVREAFCRLMGLQQEGAAELGGAV